MADGRRAEHPCASTVNRVGPRGLSPVDERETHYFENLILKPR
jgi:hypothetical protein